MKKFSLALIASIFILFSLAHLASAPKSTEYALRPRYVENEVLVKFKTHIDASLISEGIALISGRLVTYLGDELLPQERIPSILSQMSFTADPDLFLIRVPGSIGTERAIAILKSNPNVEYAEKNLIMYPLTIDDPLFESQWALANTGEYFGTSGVDIDALPAWTICTGSPDVVVAVIGIGVDSTHPDLAANMWENPFEIAGNGVDDDHNNFTDDTKGWHFGTDIDPTNPNPPTGDPHETQAAGIIAAVWNDIGIRGINQNVKIMRLRTDTVFMGITVANFINAIDYAVDNGAAIISCSQGWADDDLSGGDKLSFEGALVRARDRGVLFVSAAGNYDPYRGRDWYDVDECQSQHMYPGCFPEDNIINVMATDPNDARESNSMWGEISVDLGAPGGSIKTTSNFQGYSDPSAWYALVHGTSFAAPHVAGVAALALGKCPALSYGTLKSRILNYGEALDSLDGKCVSGKRLNAYGVVHDPSNPTTPSAPANLGASSTSWNKVHLWWTDNSANEAGFEVQRYSGDRPAFMRYQSVGPNIHAFDDNWATTKQGNPAYSYRVRAGNLGGMSSFSNTVNITMQYSAPEAPSDLAAQTNIIPNIELTWTDNATNEQVFVLERKKTGAWTQIATLNGDTTAYTDHVTQSGTYYYRIKAQNPVGSSSYSNQLTVIVEYQ